MRWGGDADQAGGTDPRFGYRENAKEGTDGATQIALESPRYDGGGRKKASLKDPDLVFDLEKLLEPVTGGEPGTAAATTAIASACAGSALAVPAKGATASAVTGEPAARALRFAAVT